MDIVDISAYFGILYLRVALCVNLLSREEIWDHESGNDLFAGTFSQNRFKFTNWLMTFDDKPTWRERWKSIRFVAIWRIFKMSKIRCASYLLPPSLAVNETLYPHEARIGFKQYNFSKLAMYGLHYRSLSNAEVLYTYFNSHMQVTNELHSKMTKHYVTETNEYTKYLVTQFIMYSDIDERNVSMDQYFTLVALVKWALTRNSIIIGTLKFKRKGVRK